MYQCYAFPSSSKPVKPLGAAVAAMSEGAPLAAPENYPVCNRGSERQILGRYVVMGCFREAQAPRPPTCRAAWTLGPVQRVGQNYQSPFTFPSSRRSRHADVSLANRLLIHSKPDRSRPILAWRNQGDPAPSHSVPIELVNSLRSEPRLRWADAKPTLSPFGPRIDRVEQQ